MEKTILHWKAEHPSLIISSMMLLGILLSQFRVFTDTQLFILLLTSWFLLILVQQFSKDYFTKSICTIISLIFWGYCIVQLKANTSNPIFEYVDPFINPIRNSILHKIDIFIISKSNNEFAKALLIGQKNNIDPNTIEAYTALGIVHIIAISGMHIDIVAHYLTKLVSWIPKNKLLQLLELVFLITVIIIYTLIAHASPSIVRAALFFCLFKIGTYFNLNKYVLNGIASGLLIVLLFDHQSIVHIGWQLSYAAVLGIHFLHPRLNKSIPLKNPVIQSIWNNFSITISTQLTSLPLLIYYFHSISTGIILSNMLMIPITNLLLEALLLLIVLPIYWIKTFQWGQIIEWYMQKMDQLVHYIFTISPQPIQFTGFSIHFLLAYYLIFLYLCLWKKRYNQPLFRFSTKMA